MDPCEEDWVTYRETRLPSPLLLSLLHGKSVREREQEEEERRRKLLIIYDLSLIAIILSLIITMKPSPHRGPVVYFPISFSLSLSYSNTYSLTALCTCALAY